MQGTKTHRNAGFTLVELLVVIVIIGMLAALTVGGVMVARRSVKQAAINFEIQSMSGTLDAYKNKYGEYPPDFTDMDAVNSHLRKRFPDYRGGAAGMIADVQANYGITLTPASALPFWLGGLPRNPAGPYVAEGFNADGAHPFAVGGTRDTEIHYEFDENRAVVDPATGELTYMANSPSPAPFVYFRSKVVDRATSTRGYMPWDPAAGGGAGAPLQAYVSSSSGTAVPYQSDSGSWYENESFQIISAGMDGEFGEGTPDIPRLVKPGTGLTEGDRDNITNFVEAATIDGDVE